MYGVVSSHPCARGWEIYSQDIFIPSSFYTVKHFLLLFKNYEGSRKELEVGGEGKRNMRTESLLGDPKLVKNTLEYVEGTGRFNFA